MAGKIIEFSPGGQYVIKKDKDPEVKACEKQAKNLQDAYSVLGNCVLPLEYDGYFQGWAQKRLYGFSLEEMVMGGTLKDRHILELYRLQTKQIAAKKYVGDLNWHNLIWEESCQTWAIIDCGATRPKSDDELKGKLEEQITKKWRLELSMFEKLFLDPEPAPDGEEEDSDLTYQPEPEYSEASFAPSRQKQSAYARAPLRPFKSARNLISSEGWVCTGLPDSDRFLPEWQEDGVHKTILRVLYRARRMGWDVGFLRYLCDCGPVKLNPTILALLPGARAFERCMRKAPNTLQSILNEMVRYAGWNRNRPLVPIKRPEHYYLSLLDTICFVAKYSEHYSDELLLRNKEPLFICDGYGSSYCLDNNTIYYWRGNLNRETPKDSTGRSIDRAIQQNPDIAIQKEPNYYENGKKEGSFWREVMEWMAELAKDQDEIVILGRDGDIIYQLCQRMGLRTRYALVNRTMTSYFHANGPIPATLDEKKDGVDRIAAYLNKTLPHKAWYVDTGYQGSIPRWIGNHNWEVSGISMLTSDYKEYQMPVNPKGEFFTQTGKTLRNFIIDEVEHGPQRLKKRADWSKPSGYNDSQTVSSFWARLYGICDALGLPKKPVKPQVKPKTVPTPVSTPVEDILF